MKLKIELGLCGVAVSHEERAEDVALILERLAREIRAPFQPINTFANTNQFLLERGFSKALLSEDATQIGTAKVVR